MARGSELQDSVKEARITSCREGPQPQGWGGALELRRGLERRHRWTLQVRLDWWRAGGQRKAQKEKAGPGFGEPRTSGWRA